METEIILLDTSILIDFYRKKIKHKSAFWKIAEPHRMFAISAITHFEIYSGARNDQAVFWYNLFHDFVIIPFNTEISVSALSIDAELKKKNQRIAIPDLIIASTALVNNLTCATLNKKHFERIEHLKLI